MADSPATASRRASPRRGARTAAALAMLAVTATAGCASSPEAVDAAYVSTHPYRSLTCAAIAEELRYLRDLRERLTAAQRQRRRGDALLIAASPLILPLFFVSGDDAQTYDLARVKGELRALGTVDLQKGCR